MTLASSSPKRDGAAVLPADGVTGSEPSSFESTAPRTCRSGWRCHDVQADSVGALDGGVYRRSLGNVAQGRRCAAPGLVPIVHWHTLKTRGAGTRGGSHARVRSGAVSNLAWVAGDHR